MKKNIIIGIIITVICGIIFMYQTQKVGFHEDEGYTIASSVNPLLVEKQITHPCTRIFVPLHRLITCFSFATLFVDARACTYTSVTPAFFQADTFDAVTFASICTKSDVILEFSVDVCILTVFVVVCASRFTLNVAVPLFLKLVFSVIGLLFSVILLVFVTPQPDIEYVPVIGCKFGVYDVIVFPSYKLFSDIIVVILVVFVFVGMFKFRYI